MHGKKRYGEFSKHFVDDVALQSACKEREPLDVYKEDCRQARLWKVNKVLFVVGAYHGLMIRGIGIVSSII